jgi:uncharacterized membrane protein YhaH (DUF805 family)
MAQLAGTLFSPKGTIGKRNFWTGLAVAIGLLILSGVVDAATEGAANRVVGLLFALVLQLVGIVIWFMIAIKRCRTLGQSPWLSLLLFIPIVGLIWLIVIGARNAPNAGESAAVTSEATLVAPVLHIGGFAVVLAAVAALVMATLALHVCVGVISRYGLGAPMQLFASATFERVAIYGFIIVLSCGVLVFLTISRDRNPRAERAGLWLALPIGIALAVLALAALGASIGVALLPRLSWSLLQGAFSNYAVVGVGLILFAVSTFGRTPRRAACLCVPLVLAPLAAVMVEVSIIRAAIWLLLPTAGLGCIALVLGLAASKRTDAVLLTIGAGIAVAYAILLAPGILTPTELSAFVFAGALLALGILWLAGEGQRVAAGLVSATVNAAALLAATVATVAIAQFWSFSGAGASVMKMLVQSNVLSATVTAMLVPVALACVVAILAYLATPLIALALLPLAFGVLAGLGVGSEVTLPAVVFGALAGFILSLYTSAATSDGDARPAGLIILTALALALGSAAYFLAPIGRFLAQLLFY